MEEYKETNVVGLWGIISENEQIAEKNTEEMKMGEDFVKEMTTKVELIGVIRGFRERTKKENSSINGFTEFSAVLEDISSNKTNKVVISGSYYTTQDSILKRAELSILQASYEEKFPIVVGVGIPIHGDDKINDLRLRYIKLYNPIG